MNIARLGVVFVLGGAMLAGCNSSGLRAYDRYELGPAREIVASSTEAIGGIAFWRSVGKVRTNVLMTIYDDQGQAYVNRQQQTINIRGGKITAEARASGSLWKAKYSRSGRFSLSGAEALDRITPQQLRQALSIVLHRVGGPLNLLGRAEQPRSAEKVYLDAQEFVRVAVTGDESNAVAYYFDPASGLLQMIASGTDRPGRPGTVSLYTYQKLPDEKLPDDMFFPAKIRVVRTGEHVLIGQVPVMEIEFSDVRID